MIFSTFQSKTHRYFIEEYESNFQVFIYLFVIFKNFRYDQCGTCISEEYFPQYAILIVKHGEDNIIVLSWMDVNGLI